MTFTSLTFIGFLPLVFALYWLLRTPRRQNLILILASYLFYGWWDYRFCALILFSSLLDFVLGWYLGQARSKRARKWLLGASLFANLGMLGLFKYFNFFAGSFSHLATGFGWTPGSVTLNIILPVGISFYTFQTLSYSIDIYRGKIRATKNILDYLAFVSFFPQLVAGPIERASHLLPQFEKLRRFDQGLARSGCRLILWGFFKKIVIADRLGVVVDQFYAQPELVSGPLLAFATVSFAFQIYCDFSAYSDIAIGTGRLFGIRLMRNFAYPYFSQSVGEFWRRWHISLSTWFRDYVYIPLGGSQQGSFRRTRNLLATFFGKRFMAWCGLAVPGVGRRARQHGRFRSRQSGAKRKGETGCCHSETRRWQGCDSHARRRAEYSLLEDSVKYHFHVWHRLLVLGVFSSGQYSRRVIDHRAFFHGCLFGCGVAGIFRFRRGGEIV